MNKIAPETREVVRESASEIKQKLKADVSNWTKARRFISLKPTMGCIDCDATGRVACATCDGTGVQKLVWNDEQTACATCEGKGTVTCSECMGRKYVKNVNRKRLLWLIGIGTACWAFALWMLFKPDILPEQQAKYLHGNGGGGPAVGARFGPRNGQPGNPGGNSSGPAPATNGSQPGGQPGVVQPGVGNPGGMPPPSQGGGFGNGGGGGPMSGSPMGGGGGPMGNAR